jgi:RNA-splicing ligase RtcB
VGHVFFDHTGDVAVSLEAPTAAGLFREAARALTEILTDFAQVRAAVPHPEEMPEAYKDVADVVRVVHEAGIATRVAQLKPLGVIKG